MSNGNMEQFTDNGSASVQTQFPDDVSVSFHPLQSSGKYYTAAIRLSPLSGCKPLQCHSQQSEATHPFRHLSKHCYNQSVQIPVQFPLPTSQFLVESPAYFIARQQACIQIAAAIYTQARLRTSLFCFLLYQLSLWWVKYRAQPEAIST